MSPREPPTPARGGPGTAAPRADAEMSQSCAQHRRDVATTGIASARRTSCGDDYGYVRANTTTLRTYNLCSSTASTTWTQGSVSLAAYAGQTITLRFRATAPTLSVR